MTRAMGDSLTLTLASDHDVVRRAFCPRLPSRLSQSVRRLALVRKADSLTPSNRAFAATYTRADMSLELRIVEHGPDIRIPIGLEDGLKFTSVPNTAVDGSVVGDYNLVATSELSDEVLDAEVCVYRAELRPVLGDGQSIPVVVKMAMTAESFHKLVDEGQFYATHLVPLVKECLVPVCYGAYEASSKNREDSNENEERVFGCLVLRDCGERLGPGNVRLPDRTPGGRAEIIRHAFRVDLLTSVLILNHTTAVPKYFRPSGECTNWGSSTTT